MTTTTSQNSLFIQSLVDFINDTKPYHSKLTEVVEEYQFSDSMAVEITENSTVQTKIDPAYLFNFYSGGDPTFRTMGLKQLHSPLAATFSPNETGHIGSIKVGRDEITDFASIPYVYSKKAFDGPGVNDVLIQRNGNASTQEALVEGLDYFTSKGGIQIQIRQTADAQSNFVPSWVETRNAGVISAASANTRALALDSTNPASAVRRIKALLLQIQALALSSLAITHLNALLATIAIPDLPRGVPDPSTGYEPLLNQLVLDGTPVLPGYAGWIGTPSAGQNYVSAEFSQLTPSMYFNVFGDTQLEESGLAEYSEVTSPWLTITNITTSALAVPGDVWSIVANSNVSPVYVVFSLLTGFVGTFLATVGGTSFTSSSISFTATHISQPSVDDSVTIDNVNRLVFGPSAPLEAWDIIKTNPLAYSRPAFISTRYGYIQDATAQVGLVTIVDTSLPTGTIILTARADGQYFDLSSTVDPLYTGVVQVGALFNDGHLAFTIVAGSVQPFQQGDKFYIAITNPPASVQNLDLGYGYDLDSFDVQDLSYDIGTQKLNFTYDTRFTDYNFASLNLQITQSSVPGRSWRITAIPDQTRPIATLKKDGTTSNYIDLQADTSGILPDPAATAAALYAMFGETNAVDLQLFYASEFDVQYSDDNWNTSNSIASVSVGSSFSSAPYGISFTLTAGTRPFIGVISEHNSDPQVLGGDVFSFSVQDPPATLLDVPIGLTSSAGARLIMHGAGFYESPPANWTVLFSSPTAYTLSGILTAGTPGFQVPGGPISGTITTPGTTAYEGLSVNALGVSFTIVPGIAGFASGDSFTFSTYAQKPSYLVHGSVSGWQAPATVGVPYWNGIIGFEIDPPSAEMIDRSQTYSIITPVSRNTWTLGTGTLSLSRIRFDAPSLIYILTPTPIGSSTPTGWYVTRSDIGSLGYLPKNGSLVDTYVTLVGTNVPTANVTRLEIQITPDDFMLWNSQDVVILNPANPARLPTTSDFILVDKRTEDYLALNLAYDSVAAGSVPPLGSLAPITIDERFINTYTGPNGIPLQNTSPETAILQNWIPLNIIRRDSATSVAEFSDLSPYYDVYAAASNQLIGSIAPTTLNTFWPIQFTWDPTFFFEFLPLNAESNIVVYNSGFNELLHARISETLNFLIDGGPLSSDYLFTDSIPITIAESNTLTITTNENDTVTVVVADGPFAGFLPGYDNQPYELEAGATGYYGAGIPETSYFLEAQNLLTIVSPTPAQAARLVALRGQLDGYLNGTLENTTLAEFLSAVNSANLNDYSSTSGFGIPVIGMGMDITIGSAGANVENPSTEGASAGVADALVIIAIDNVSGVDSNSLDSTGFDAISNSTALIYSGSLPPVPSAPNLASYAAFDTPLYIGEAGTPGARVFEIAFQITAGNLATIQAMPTPKVFVWFPTALAPQQFPVVSKIGTGLYQVSVPSSTEAKLYLQPGP